MEQRKDRDLRKRLRWRFRARKRNAPDEHHNNLNPSWRKRFVARFKGGKKTIPTRDETPSPAPDRSQTELSVSENQGGDTSTKEVNDTFLVPAYNGLVESNYNGNISDHTNHSTTRNSAFYRPTLKPTSSVRWRDDLNSKSVSWRITSDANATPKQAARAFELFETVQEETIRNSIASFTSDGDDDDEDAFYTSNGIHDVSSEFSIVSEASTLFQPWASSRKSSLGSSISEETETIGGMVSSSLRQSVFGAALLGQMSAFGNIASRFSVFTESMSTRYSSAAPARRHSSMAKFANQYRYSENRRRVDENSHMIAETDWGRTFERIVIPWTPSSTEALILFLFVFSLFQTIPFGMTRLQQGVWKQVYVQQKLVNYVLEIFGFEAPFGGKKHLDGIRYPSDAENPTRKNIDFFFGFHLVAGVLWIIVASIQYFMTNKVSKKAHRSFGYFASFLFTLHLMGSLAILYSDFVHHHTASKIILFQGVVESAVYFVGGIVAIKKGDIETHRDMLVKSYLISIEGSGTIRFTAWIYYVFGSLFFSPAARICFDTVQCQSKFATASAGSCVIPYMFRLQGMRLVTKYFNCLYLRTPEKAKDITSRESIREEITQNVKFYLRTLACILVFACTDRSFFMTEEMGENSWVNWKNVFSSFDRNGAALQFVAYTAYTYFMFRDRMQGIERTLLMPRRNAVAKTSIDTFDEVRVWAERHGLRDSTMPQNTKPRNRWRKRPPPEPE